MDKINKIDNSTVIFDLVNNADKKVTIAAIHMHSRVLFYPDLISRQLDHVQLPREGTATY